jgi:hypothetical protein
MFFIGIFILSMKLSFMLNQVMHIEDHISRYEGSDIALIGPYIPHLNFDYGVKNTVNTVVSMKEHFSEHLFSLPEMNAIKIY